ncbi:MAG TPA: amino acid permease, partial [Bacteroidetes bacterium]|nr:amino acid permease [Bacteroidota bacterium]
LVVAGIWGATLSSALGGILGGPRILQAMSLDKITPKFFAKGTGKNKEPRLALIFTVILAGSGILIGELNMIARIVSMFYLAAYGFINLSFFLESWASSDFRPSFKVNKWIGFVGFIVTFIIMFKLDMFAMLLAFIIIGGIYFWLSRKEFSAGEGDVWQSVWTNIIKRGLRTLTDKEEHKRNWKPNILLFSGKSNARQYLLEFSRFLTGKTGIVTNFDLTVNKEPGELFSKEKQNYHDDLLEKYGVFGRQMEVNNLYTGIETIASVFGFSGIDPNTVLMGWAKNSKDPVSFARMTNKLMKLDYNVLYLDYDKQKGFGEYKTIDLWWRGISRNAELTLMLVKSLVLSQEWRRAKVRIILVNNTGDDQHLIKKRIEHLIISFRVVAEVFIINNYTENKSIFELMKIHSGSTDLIMLGIPDIREGEEKGFVKNVNNLVDILGTTLLVKASSEFGIADLGIHKQEISKKASNHVLFLPPLFKPAFEDELIAIEELEKDLANSSPVFESEVINPVVKRYLEIAAKLKH